jgi:hypothetical protein
MEASLSYVAKCIFPTFLLFGLFKPIHTDLSNSLCAIAIFSLSISGFVFDAMATFICYLLIDMVWRDHKMPSEIVLHHLGCAILTFLGLVIILKLRKPEIVRAISYLLNMEITTPILHAAKRFKRDNFANLALTALAILIMGWIPFRILYPTQSLYLIYNLYISEKTWGILVCLYLIIGLVILQIAWFFRLCVLFVNGWHGIM